MEKTIEFIVDGVPAGSSELFISDGKIDTSAAEEKFYKILRQNSVNLEEEEHEHIIDSLSKEQEDKLQEAHAKDYHGTDDDMSDAFEAWLEDLSLEELKRALA